MPGSGMGKGTGKSDVAGSTLVAPVLVFGSTECLSKRDSGNVPLTVRTAHDKPAGEQGVVAATITGVYAILPSAYTSANGLGPLCKGYAGDPTSVCLSQPKKNTPG